MHHRGQGNLTGAAEAERYPQRGLCLVLAVFILLIYCPFLGSHPSLGALASTVTSQSPPERSILAEGGISVTVVQSQYLTVARGQKDVPIRVSVRNDGASDVLIQHVTPSFTNLAFNDRFADYSVKGDVNPDTLLPPLRITYFDFLVDVGHSALANVNIQIDAVVRGYVVDTNEEVSDSSATMPHNWTVTAQSFEALAAVYDTRLTPVRSDDGLVGMVTGEDFPYNAICFLNGGQPLGRLLLDGTSTYRAILQLKPSSDWNYELKLTELGFLGMEDPSGDLGLAASPVAGVRELLLTDALVPNEGPDSTDFVVGATKKVDPPTPWTMQSDPWTDQAIDIGKTAETGTFKLASFGRNIVDCIEGVKSWEITGNFEHTRYYFYEFSFRPDLEWASGDTADVYLHFGGNPEPAIQELHVRFLLADEDTLGPTFSEFAPTIAVEFESFNIVCKIDDPSGVYDDGTGSAGQGVYLVWDDDGSLSDGFHETTMSPIGGGYYQSDAAFGPYNIGDVVLYRVHACDDDSDGGSAADRSCSTSEIRSVQVLGAVYIVDEPSSLYPASVYAGQAGVSLHLEFNNPMTFAVTLFPASTIRFSSGADVVVANLGNETIIPGKASHFPVAFNALQIPTGFSAPDTLEARLNLVGLYNGNPYSQDYTASETNRLVILERRLRFEAYAVPAGVVHPGDATVELMRLVLTNESAEEMRLDSLVVSNVTRGQAPVPINDVNIRAISLFRQNPSSSGAAASLGEETIASEIRPAAAEPAALESNEKPEESMTRSLAADDSLVAQAFLVDGQATLALTEGRSLAAGQSVFFYVTAEVDSFMACDGDSLDLMIASPSSIFSTGPGSVSFAETPLNSEGKSFIDGAMSFQIKLDTGLPDTLYLGDADQLVASIVVPANGYWPDVLSGLAVKNFGDYEANGLVERLELWTDDGDGSFTPGSDSLLGTLIGTGDRFEISGLSLPLAAARRLFVTADLRLGSTNGVTAIFGMPQDGVQVASGNDGPLDASIVPGGPQLLVRREVVSMTALPIAPGLSHPGDTDVELLALEVDNGTLGSLTIDSLRISAAPSLFACVPEETVRLYADDGDRSFSASNDTLVSQAAMKTGSAVFAGFGYRVASDQHGVLFVAANLDSFSTVDGETLLVSVASARDVSLVIGPVTPSLYRFEAQFPLRSPGGAVTDGMLSHQVTLYPGGDSTFVDQKKNILILDVRIPGNGCLDDTLKALTITNLGTAGKEHIKRLLLWRDDGDGSFDPALDQMLAQFTDVGVNGYEVSGLGAFIPGSSGIRSFVTMDLNEIIESGATVRAAIPWGGIQVASGNDGPIDGDIVSTWSIVIPVPDRVTVFTSILGNKRVRPGEEHVLNLVLGMYNGYQEMKTLRSLEVLSIGSSNAGDVTQVEAFADFDGDGLFDPERDRLLEVADPTPTGYLFHELNAPLRSAQSTLLFIAYATALVEIRDSVRVDFQVNSKSSIGFGADAVVVQGDFPLNSAGIDVTDGMVSAQIKMLPVEDSRVSPSEIDVPCISFIVPCNGSVVDVLEGLSVLNEGSAVQGQDVEYVKLWKEMGGDQSFGPDDAFLGFLAWDGQRWRNFTPLSEPIPCGGLTLHVTVDVAPTAADGRTIDPCIPPNGITVTSGNDGPIDGAACSTAHIEITTDPLLSSLACPSAVTKDQLFDVRMLVRNAADTTLHAVMPDSFSYSGSGSLTLLSGPQPPSMELAGGADSSFVWSYRAVSVGTIVFRGRAISDGGAEASAVVSSDTVTVDAQPENVTATLRDLAPVSLNRGTQDAAVIEMTIAYEPLSGQGAPVAFGGMAIQFMDESGGALSVQTVAAAVRLRDESRVLCVVPTDGVSESVVALAVAEPVLFEPGSSKTFRISIDIAPAASAPRFKLSVQSASALTIVDHNSGAPVPFTGTAFPWFTNVVTVTDPATSLRVLFAPRLPQAVNKGQEQVPAFDLVLTNASGASAADVSVSEIVITARDAAGDSIDAGRVMRAFTLRGETGNMLALVENFAGRAEVRCRLQPPVVVSAQVSVILHAVLDCLSDPGTAAFSMTLDDSLDISARDVNSGRPIDVIADQGGPQRFPMGTGSAVFRNPLRDILVSGSGLLPERVMAGAARVPALRIVLKHPGSPSTSAALCDSVTLRFLDEGGRALKPDAYLSVVRIAEGASELATVYVTAQHASDVPLRFSTPVLIEPGSSDTLDVSLDCATQSASGSFQMHVNAAGLDIRDATDGRNDIGLGGDFPLTSGIATVVFPADLVLFGASGRLPANVAAGEEAEVFELSLSRASGATLSRAFVRGIVFDVLDGDDAAIDPSRIVADVRVADAVGEIGTAWTVADGRLRVDFTDTVAVADGETHVLTMRARIAARPDVSVVSFRVAASGDVSCSDEATGGPVAISTAAAFPFSSGRAAILASDIEASFSNYPNPFVGGSEDTRITFYLPSEGTVTLRVFTVTGEPVRTIVNGMVLNAGLHQEFSWDGRNGRGDAVLNGVYYLLFKAKLGGQEYSLKRKVAVVR